MSRKFWWLLAIVAFALSTLCLVFTGCSERQKEYICRYYLYARYDGERGIDSKLTLDYVNCGESEVDELYFHLYPAAYREGAQYSPLETPLSGQDCGGITVSAVRGESVAGFEVEGLDEDILRVDLSLPIAPTEGTGIEIEFALILPLVNHRLGYFSGVANLGNWYPILCASYDGEVDTSPYYDKGDPFFSEVASYEVTLEIPSELTAATTGSQKTENCGEYQKIISKCEKVRDFAIVIGNFDTTKTTVDGVEICYFSKNQAEADECVLVARQAKTTYSECFGEYPYKSLSVVEAPLCFGGMEYPGLVMISDGLTTQMKTEVIAHEIAHQWWYAVVGSNQIEEAWLDEGLAEYSTTIFYERNPEWGVTRAARMSDAVSAYSVYLGSTADKSTAMNRRLVDFPTKTDYAFCSYVKGALMLDSLRRAVGDEKFFAVLRLYYKQNAFCVATTQSFLSAICEKAGEGAAELVSTLVNGKEINALS